MKKLIMASNILPLVVSKEEDRYEIEVRTGGFLSGLESFYQDHSCVWVGSPVLEHDRITNDVIKKFHHQLVDKRCYPIWNLTVNQKTQHYGFCNKTIWPLFHYFPQNTTYNKRAWNAYVKVNEMYADKIMEIIEEGDILWIHDYHLMLLPNIIRERTQNISIGFFLHIPFPSFEIFRLLPWRLEVLKGLMGADLIGFQTFDYERHFMSCIRRLLGYDTYLNQIKLDGRVLKADNFPLGIDYEKFSAFASQVESQDNTKNHFELFDHFVKGKDKKVILSIDRLDYAKGITDRLKAYEYFLRNNPQYLEKISMLLFVTPSRENVEEYKNLKSEVDELVGRINGQYGIINWMPIWYFYRTLTFEELVELYNSSDIALITPIRDGMNLIAKEFIASKPNGTGVLILSEMAGASKEMSEAIIVNPNNRIEVAEAIKNAIEMPEQDQITRNRILQSRLKQYNDRQWANHFLEGLYGIKDLQAKHLTKKITSSIEDELCNKFNADSNRILFLDYDGTLSEFTKDPQKAGPDDELLQILEALSGKDENDIVIISGRDKETLGKWFNNDWNITFIAEHGVWTKKPGSDWSMIEQINKDWMQVIRPTLEFYVDRTPGSFIEDKNYSLVWHYRKTDPDLGTLRAWELKDELQALVVNLNLEIMDGDKVIEIKNAGVNKGRSALIKLGESEYDFIGAFGDDWTDEYTFEAMPEKAVTVKVGTKSSKARYYVESVSDVRRMLTRFVKC